MAHNETAQNQEPPKETAPSEETAPSLLLTHDMTRLIINDLLASSKQRLTGRELVIALELASHKKIQRMSAYDFTVNEAVRGKHPPRSDELKDLVY